jgi:alpha-glucuronidase
LSSKTLAQLAEIHYPIFVSYGIKLYVSVCFASPQVLGGLNTSDPLDNNVIEWWSNKTQEIYTIMPEFGGFLVKADAEGQAGPDTYHRTEAEGANVMAKAMVPHGGIVVWRAFVYGHSNLDRAVQAYDTFMPLDGKFMQNVVVQVKNGPMDFQVREPVSPILGQLPKTNVMLEVQAAQEYTGQQIHVVGLSKQWESYLQFDTHVQGPNSTLSKLLMGEIWNYSLSGMAAVSNMGDDRNWTVRVIVLVLQRMLHSFARSCTSAGQSLTRRYAVQQHALRTTDHGPDCIRLPLSSSMPSPH